MRSTPVLRDDGVLTQWPGEVHDCWYQNFKNFKVCMMKMFHCYACTATDLPPTMEELEVTISKMKVGKTGGLSMQDFI